ncbi:MAG: hypothetical protein P8M26_10130 [Gammaproteobacteria bacterium]|nr:hypothetical protein [Gammaproteobacteria bacterium]
MSNGVYQEWAMKVWQIAFISLLFGVSAYADDGSSGFEKAGAGIDKGLTAAGDGIKKGMEGAGKGIEKGADATGGALRKAGDATADAFEPDKKAR